MDWKISKLRDLFPDVSVPQAHALLAQAHGSVDDAVDAALLQLTNGDIVEDSEPQPIAEFFNRPSTSKSSAPQIESTTDCRAHQAKELLLSLKLAVAIEGLPKEQIWHNLVTILNNVNCTISSIGDLKPCLQADYEEKFVQLSVDVELSMRGNSAHETLSEFAKSFVFESGYGLSMQPLMEIRNMDKIYTGIKANHDNIDITWLGMGSMPNTGTFFIRGEYIAKYNMISNRSVVNGVSETKMNNATGCHQLLSWAHMEHDRRILTIYFAIEMCNRASDGLMFTGYKLVLSYNSFTTVIVDCDCDPDERDNYIYILLRHPPQLWEAVPRTLINGRRVLNIEQCRDWIRVLSWQGNKHFAGCSQEALAESQWLSFSIPKQTVKPDNMSPNEVIEWAQRPLSTKLAPTRHLFEIIARISRRAKCRLHFGAVFRVTRRRPPHTQTIQLPSFRANYALEALLSRGSVVTDQIFDFGKSSGGNLLLDRLLYTSQECLEVCEETLDAMLAAIVEQRRISLLKFYEYNYSLKLNALGRLTSSEAADATSSLPKNCVLTRKVMVTPLRLLILPPEVMMTNRVVRFFGEEYALRCIFRDDNGQRLVPKEFARGRSLQDQSLIIPQLIYRTLINGIRIGTRHYQFLAWSNSQMRDHGCYMYADAVVRGLNNTEVIYTIDDIRRWMGDFGASRNVPKLMSRMGQCFTQAQPTLVLKACDWRLDEDIVGGMKHPETGELYNFSDGVGRISQKFAEKIAAMLELHPVPSCYQVRFKGFKGVLCIDPSLDADPNGVNIVFRKSQKKFDEDQNDAAEIEVVKHSMPSPVCLNRPLIMILDQVSAKQDRKTHERVCRRIRKLLERELNTLASMMLDEDDAAEALSTRLSLPIDFQQLHKNGFTFTNEPFFRSLLIAIHRYNIKHHLSKSKLFLPGTLGRTMYGVIDDTGLLQYGQVFIQYSSSIRNASEKVTTHIGPVMVTKNPCHVAGDVRMFQAVYQDALSHLRDVIVFPRYGPRPHPDEMAGSDLDGDEYTVIFDRELFFNFNEPPMFFPKTTPVEYDTVPDTEDMVNFFLKYLSQDSIGRMSNAHLIMCDRLGLFHETCDEIARKCAIAVDFPKTGEPAEPLTLHEQSDVVPDFMQNSIKPAYRSCRLLGELYRCWAKKAKKVEDIAEIVQTGTASECDEHLFDESIFHEHPALIERSFKLRSEYNSRLQQLIDEYAISDEASVVSGHSVTIKRITDMEKDDYSFYHSDKIVELRYNRIFTHFRREFFKEFGDESDFITMDAFGKRGVRWNSALILKAKAWYAVTYADRVKTPSEFRSFPWIVWDILMIVKRQILLEMRRPLEYIVNPLALYLTSSIEKFCEARQAQIQQFINKLATGPSRSETFVHYANKYGSKLVSVCFVIDNWLNIEGVYERSAIRSIHAIILFLQFGIGVLHGKHSAETLINKQPVFFEQISTDTPEQCDFSPIMYSHGEMLLGFIRYLASEQFAHAECLRFSRGGMLRSEPSAIFTRSTQWAMLNAVAFRTLHHMAVTAGFDALHLSQDDEPQQYWDYGESDAPAIVSGELCAHKELTLQRIIAVLKKWSGVDELVCRSAGKRDQLLVSCAGGAIARQRLQRILLLNPSRLFHAIHDNQTPREACEQFL